MKSQLFKKLSARNLIDTAMPQQNPKPCPDVILLDDKINKKRVPP